MEELLVAETSTVELEHFQLRSFADLASTMNAAPRIYPLLRLAICDPRLQCVSLHSPERSILGETNDFLERLGYRPECLKDYAALIACVSASSLSCSLIFTCRPDDPAHIYPSTRAAPATLYI